MDVPKAPNFFLLVVIPALFLIILTTLINVVMFYNDVDYTRIAQENIFTDINVSIETEINDAILATHSLKAFFLSSNEVDEQAFIQFSKYLVEEFNNYGRNVTFQWVDKDSVVRYIYPLTPVNKSALNFDNKAYPNRMVPILKAIETKSIVVTEPLELVQGYPGVIIYNPIFKNEQYLGCTVSVVKLEDFTSKISDEVKVNYRSQIHTDNRIFSLFGQSIYDKEGNLIPSPLDLEETGFLEPLEIKDTTLSNTLSFADKYWTIALEQNYRTEAANKMTIYGFLFLTFLILSISLIYLNYKSRVQNVRVLSQEIDLRKNLEIEVMKRKEYEKKLSTQYDQLQQAQKDVVKSNEELRKLNELMLGREMKMIEMKRQLGETKI